MPMPSCATIAMATAVATHRRSQLTIHVLQRLVYQEYGEMGGGVLLPAAAVGGEQFLRFAVLDHGAAGNLHPALLQDVSDLLVGQRMRMILVRYDALDSGLDGEGGVEEEVERHYFLVRELDVLVGSGAAHGALMHF